jgi:hypothetical protein
MPLFDSPSVAIPSFSQYSLPKGFAQFIWSNVKHGEGRYAAILWVESKDVNKAAKTLGMD